MRDLLVRLRSPEGMDWRTADKAMKSAADLIENMAQELGECSGGYETLEKELAAMAAKVDVALEQVRYLLKDQEVKHALLEEVLPIIEERQTWDGHTTVEPGGLLDRMYRALGKK